MAERRKILIDLTRNSRPDPHGYETVYGHPRKRFPGTPPDMIDLATIPPDIECAERAVSERIERIRSETGSDVHSRRLFWLIDHRDFYSHLLNQFTRLEQVYHILDKEQADIHLKVHEDDAVIIEFFDPVRKPGITFHIVKRGTLSKRPWTLQPFRKIIFILSLSATLIMALTRKLISRRKTRILMNDVPESVFLSMEPGHEWDFNRKFNPHQHIVQKVLADGNMSYIHLDFLAPNIPFLHYMMDKLKHSKNYLPLEVFLPWKDVAAYFLDSWKLRRQFEILLGKMLATTNYSYALVPDNLLKMISIVPPFLVAYDRSLQQLMKRKKILGAFFQPEAGLVGRWVGPLFTSRGIRFIGVEHGLIHRSNIAYRHLAHHINPVDYVNAAEDPEFCPLPHYTLVWSQKVRKLLVDTFNYPPESVIVTGNPQISMLTGTQQARDTVPSGALLRASGKKIILLATRTGGKGHTEEFDKSLLRSVYSIPLLLGDHFILCKLHRLEGSRLHEAIYRELGLNNQMAFITRDMDIISAMKMSDLVVSVRSTTVFEAMAIQKPVLIVNPGNADNDAVQLRNTGGVYYATDLEGILNELERIRTGMIPAQMKQAQLELAQEKLGELDIDTYKRTSGFVQEVFSMHVHEAA